MSDGEDRENEKKKCGPHTELASNPAARITRCGCGTIHLHIARSGVTLQLSRGQFAEVSATVAGAFDALRLFDEKPASSTIIN